ncbi:hypothetical protein MBLNU13_g08515t1 [Cladosporium sp. NU13]
MAIRDKTTVSHSGSGPINIHTGSGDSFHGMISGGSGHVQYIAKHQYIQTVGGGADQDRLDKKFRDDDLYLTSPEIQRRTLIAVRGAVVDGTCDWILAQQTFVAWLFEEEQRLLWVHAGPGRGKTMLSIFITAKLEERARTIYFFCNGDDDKCSSATAVLRGLLWHLTKLCPWLTRGLRETLGPDIAAALSSRVTLWQAFRGLVEAMRSEQLYCVIDGLEECDWESAQWLARMFTALHESDLSNNLKTVMLSRPCRVFWDLNQTRLDYAKTLVPSVWTYAQMKVRELSHEFEFDEKTSEYVRETLCDYSEGNFLWIGLVMVTLREQRDVEGVLRTLRQLPRGLKSLYDHMFHKMESSQGAMVLRLLGCVSLACRPLTLDELTFVVASWPRDGPPVERELVQDLIRYCGPSLQLARQTVTLTHGSLREYANSYDSPDGSHLLPERVHLRLAWACIEALAQQGQRSPLAQYAAEYWPFHARRSATFAKELISHPSSFFNASSELRTRWWIGPSSPKMISKERDIPVLHLACLLGIEPWVNDIIGRHKGLWIRFWGSTNPVLKQDHEGRTALHLAAAEGYVAIAKLLLRHGAKVDVEDEHGLTALHLATKAGFVEMAKFLIDHEADVEAPDKTGWTALHWAVHADQEGMVRVLLKQKANVDARDNSEARKSPLDLASRRDATTMVDILLGNS